MGVATIAFKLTRPTGRLASVFHAKATTATIRAQLIAAPARLAWEERRVDLAKAAVEALVAPAREPSSITDLLPQPKRRHRSA